MGYSSASSGSSRNGEGQVLPSRLIDPRKLSVLLKQKFGRRGTGYKVEMRHNTYRIYSQRPLSPNELNGCYYGSCR
ncbi:hypothetical protein CGMCC3_g3344 [Colletotrichum fructicola]|uniref:Uncharacterized protein n=1 Tax=Colletotrichum fructicola (strain Nara gc5) TaxID=1213859 RepID=A0A7J6ISQ2_COLFN|nr:uncharacterized protein CGMCC3_g3344 [Colletotrichum fructicola]KAE9580618.1 hypothetical protein CGMCC3_g3344 [Colletotrichum fructicola]KAF4422687.1 hypothetical protein CFRS1_v001198 [Colletotrichum fructicola]KAF4479063.1 hypothetical protein CGGC5_v012640 [Colletotrichum fructicola Nara gc5]KAF5490350.1 hypothetical protein CGCF413_v011572 [Colletotrichum fructicola]